MQGHFVHWVTSYRSLLSIAELADLSLSEAKAQMVDDFSGTIRRVEEARPPSVTIESPDLLVNQI